MQSKHQASNLFFQNSKFAHILQALAFRLSLQIKQASSALAQLLLQFSRRKFL